MCRSRSHDWTEHPYAHLGEKARQRDPSKFHYSGTVSPDFRKGNYKRGDYFKFAHSCPSRLHHMMGRHFDTLSTRILQRGLLIRLCLCLLGLHPDSPPMSPLPLSRFLGSGSINEIAANLHHLQLNEVKSPSPCVLKSILILVRQGVPRLFNPYLVFWPALQLKLKHRPQLGPDFVCYFFDSAQENLSHQ
ncbi:hypothetical protein GIB67_040896 [Kingdonia uniflora]|uniref:AtC3H23-like CCCH zinc finger domain-containing protein n=1 Tax=Kingdonia uniflora TaxID=39325 RepID=A0A7J7L881_9MAGN|nr:hypothetical protein GIB67_040896 [Kingdonia uniflora]